MKNLKISVFILLASYLITSCKSTAVTKAFSESSFINISWQMQEIRFLQDNDRYYYKRDASSGNNMNFDNDHIKFNDDRTGVYHQADGIDYNLTWTYNNQEKQLQFTIEKFRNGQSLTVHWENISFGDKTIHYTEYYTSANGLHLLGYATRAFK